VVCDGKSHSVGVTLVGEGFDAGKAYATAELVAAVGQSATASKQINIIVMKWAVTAPGSWCRGRDPAADPVQPI
jgi:hypothetical protein